MVSVFPADTCTTAAMHQSTTAQARELCPLFSSRRRELTWQTSTAQTQLPATLPASCSWFPQELLFQRHLPSTSPPGLTAAQPAALHGHTAAWHLLSKPTYLAMPAGSSGLWLAPPGTPPLHFCAFKFPP